jgi:hypothetical protein
VLALIQQKLVGVSGVDILEISRNVTMKGLSGYEHQIDVMYRFKLWLTEMLVLVECKQYEKRVGVDDLLEFKSRLDDLRAQKGVFVTSSNYQSGAIEFARANRIALLVVKGAEYREVLYSLDDIPVSEQCLHQVEDLHEEYHTKTLGRAERISTDKKQVVIQHNGVAVQMSPWELHTSMLYRQPCRFGAPAEIEVFFERDQFPRLPVNRLLKSLLIDELLDSTHDG